MTGDVLAKTLGFQNAIALEKYAKKCGFKDLTEFRELVYKASSIKKKDEEFQEFLTWLTHDCTKTGLLTILGETGNADSNKG